MGVATPSSQTLFHDNAYCEKSPNYPMHFAREILLLMTVSSFSSSDFSRIILLSDRPIPKLSWETALRPTRKAEVSMLSWQQYKAYKAELCQSQSDDLRALTSDYLSWEEMAFHKSLRVKLFSKSPSETDVSYSDALFLAGIDRHFVAPQQQQSHCEVTSFEESEHSSSLAEDNRFEDILINRIFSVPLSDADIGDYSIR
ncbi:hypothetical protein AB6A40_008705 [Gnathostoma spinigerum]|uniref:Uncharacterized protein n=1 Tax=Gnathostoma spinigerum TaxID=75299 RepID=A0ABD6EQ77_9BILA